MKFKFTISHTFPKVFPKELLRRKLLERLIINALEMVDSLFKTHNSQIQSFSQQFI